MKHIKSNLQEAVEIAREIPVAPRHAVFTTTTDLHRSRSTRWLAWDAAQDEWERLDDLRRAGKLDEVKFVEVRSQDDPRYRDLPYEPYRVLTAEERPTWVKLDRAERAHLLAIGRRCGGLDEAASTMFDELLKDGRWEHLPAVDISDYAWAAARFCFPQEAKY